MKTIDEDKLLASLYLNLKGSKKKRENWIEIAHQCKQLNDLYGSMQITAEKLSVSSELVRAILTLLTLPEEVQMYIKNNQILFDAGQRLARIKNTETQIEVAKKIIGLTSHDARQIIQFAKKYPHAPIDDFKKRLSSKDKIEKLNLIILPLHEDTYKIIKKIGEKEKSTPEKLILQLIDQWIEKNEPVR